MTVKVDGVADFHHVKFTVGNALQASYWYCANFGFERFAERRKSDETAIAVRNNRIVFVFVEGRSIEWARAIESHGDFACDVAFRVDSLTETLESAARRGVSKLSEVQKDTDNYGSVKTAIVRAEKSDVVHSLIQLCEYSGIFLPHFRSISDFPLLSSLIVLQRIDHVVKTYPEDGVEDAAEWYKRNFQLERFWSIDDQKCSSEFSALKAWLVVNRSQSVQVTLTEPVQGTRRGRSQIQEFLDFHDGPGVQHVAMLVNDIIGVVQQMRDRGCVFLSVPDSYYHDLRERLTVAGCDVTEDLDEIQRLNILIDFDSSGYLLQIFTKPCHDRPTLFLEVIQRRNFNGFGAGNFKALFEAIEREQELRGTLHSAPY